MKHIFKSIERLLAVLAGIALFIMMALTFVDVVGRYGFNKSIFGTSEIIELLMVVVIFAGIAFVTVADQHIKVDIFDPWIKRRAPKLQRWAVLVFSFAMYGFLTFELIRHAIDSFQSGKRTAVLDGPQWLLPGAAALFSIIGVALFLAAILTTRGHPARACTTEMDSIDSRHESPDTPKP